MLNRSLITLAIALASSAAAIVGFSAWREQPSAPSSSRHLPGPAKQSTAGPARSWDPSPANHPGRNHPAPRTGAVDPRATALRDTALTAAIENYPSRVELERRAAMVEQEANHELRRLVPLLDLSPEQEQRVFKALVRSSPNFAPGMAVGGEPLATTPTAETPATTTTDVPQAVLAELTEAQVTEYLLDADERGAWWQEYLARAASNLDAATPVPGDTTGGSGGSLPSDLPLPTKDGRAPSDEE